MKIIGSLMIASLAAALGGCATWNDKPVSYLPSPVDGSRSDAAWSLLDSDHDGFLSLDELNAQRAMGLLRDFANADSDDDSRVSRNEWNAWWPRMTRTPASPTMARLNGPTAADDRRNDDAHAPHR